MIIFKPFSRLYLIPSRGNGCKPPVKKKSKRPQQARERLTEPISEAEVQKWLADHERGH